MNIIFLLKFKSIKIISILLVLTLALGGLAACTSTTSEEYLENARKNFDRREFKTAVINLKNALQKDSKNPQARYLLGKTYLRIGNGVSAEKELETAKQLGVSLEDLIVFLGESYLLQRKPEKIIKELNPEVGFSASTRSEIFILKAQAYLMLGKTVDVNNMLNMALREVPELLSALLIKARLKILLGDYDSALQLVEKVVKEEPDNVEAWLIGAESDRLKGDFIESKKKYANALGVDPINISALLGLAGVNIETGDLQAALRRAEKIQSFSPDHPLANYIRAVVFYEQKNIDETEHALQNVFKILPGHLPSLQMYGAILFASGRYEQARVALEKVINHFPRNLAVRKLLASTWLKLGQPETAIQILEKVLAGNNKDAQFLALLGSAYIQNKNLIKGGEYLDLAVMQSPENAKIQTQLALGSFAAGKADKAVKALEMAVELGQDVFQADILLVLTRIRNKNFSKALEAARELAIKLPDSAVPHNLVGAAFLGLGDKKAARESFEKALHVQADFSPAAMNLAKLDEREGDIAAAKSRLEKIVLNNKDNIKATFALARIAGQEGNRAESEKWLNQVWKQNTDNLQVGALLVRYWIKQGDIEKAVAIGKEMKAQHPEDFSALRIYGQAQVAAGQKNDALETFRSLVNFHPEMAAAHFFLGKAYAATGGLATAEQHLNKALFLDPQFFPAQIALSQLAIKNNDFNKALRIARKIQKQKSSAGVGFALEGDIHMRSKDYSVAAQNFAKAFAKTPSGILAIRHFEAERQSKNKGAGTDSLKEWLKKNPNDVQVRIVLAQAYAESGKKRNAEIEYKKILEIDSQNVAVLNNLAWLYQELGGKNALNYGKRAFDLAPNNPAVLDTYGWLLVEIGKVEQGLPHLQKAFQKAPSVVSIQFHYAVALYRSGNMQAAKAEFISLLDKHPDFPEIAEAKMMLAKIK